MKIRSPNTVIINAPDPDIFYRNRKSEKQEDKRIRLIASSWSPNMRKGFNILLHLDANLDFTRYEMNFYGNSPVAFKNIKAHAPAPSATLAEKLRESDIFISPSENDPCSNSLIEALHCGLPAVYRRSGGHPEIVGNAGCGFESEKDVIEAIEATASKIQDYQKSICLPKLAEIAGKYYEFCKKVHETTPLERKKARAFDYLHLRVLLKMRAQLLKRRKGRRCPN